MVSPDSEEIAERSSGCSLAGMLGVVVFALICLGFHGFSEQGWVPVLDSANLALHEAGHPIFAMLSNRLMVYGGTVFQLVFPISAAWHFRRQGNVPGCAVSAVWLGENLLNIARYMADARAQVLPLVGGGEHDWTEIFGRWGALHLDTKLAGLVRVLAVVLIVSACLWVYRRWRVSRKD